MSRKFIDLTGQRFGNLIVVAQTKKPDYLKSPGKYFLCKCDCGKEKVVLVYNLSKGDIKSCGCIHKGFPIRHGMHRTPGYETWRGMHQRCYNPKKQFYPIYGGRGITVCDRWNSFENFFTDMGHPPSPKHSIERIDNNGNYEPTNCKWATNQEQANNKRNNVFLTYHGETHTMAEWSRITGIGYTTISNRLHRNHWSIEKVLDQKK